MDMSNTHLTTLDIASNKVIIKRYVLHSEMEDRVGRKVVGSYIITVDGGCCGFPDPKFHE